ERNLGERQPLLEDVLEAREGDLVGDPEVRRREEVLEDVVLEPVARIARVRLELVAEALLVPAREETRARRAADRRRDVALAAGGALTAERVDLRRRDPTLVCG